MSTLQPDQGGDMDNTDLARKQFAIRTTIRNHTELTRDIIIKQVADAVGSEHSVDLSQPEKVILVEVYKVSPKL